MEAPVSPAGCGKAPAPGEGGAAAQAGQVPRPGSGASQAAGRDRPLDAPDTTKGDIGLRIQLWEAGFVSQALPQRKTMDEERLRNFKEIQAKFQKLDALSPPGPMKSQAGVSQKGDLGSSQLVRIWANRKPLAANRHQPPPYGSSGEPQQMKLAQKSAVQKCSDAPGSPGRSAQSAVTSHKAPLLLPANQSNAEITNKRKSVATSSFRNKIQTWEKVSSQKTEMSSAFLLANGDRAFCLEDQGSTALTIPEGSKEKLQIRGSQTLPPQMHLMAQRKSCVTSEEPTFLLSPHERKSLEKSYPEGNLAESTCQPIYERTLASWAPEKQLNVEHHQLPKTKPLPSVESLGPPPTKPLKPPAVNLQAFQRQRAALPKTHREAAVGEDCLPAESAESEESHNYEATISCLRHSGNPINLCTSEEIADSIYEVEIEELQKPEKSFLHQELSPNHEDEDEKMKEKEPCELQPQKEQDPHTEHLFEVGADEESPGKVPAMEVHRHTESMPAGKQDAVIDSVQTKACPEDLKLARHFQGPCGYVEALEVTKQAPGHRAFKPRSCSEETYDDVEYPGRRQLKSDFLNSFASESEANNKEMYEDVYKTKNNSTKIDLDGKALKRLQRFFKKEKDRFKVKKTKLKENISTLSVSLPDLELRTQEVIIHDDVNISEKVSKDEDKVKIWKPKLFKPKGKRERKGAEESESLSPRNFFRTKKQNLEKDRMEREQLFRERFEYDKEITVINTAVACSCNSRAGVFDLPITPGEELEVIDVTEENLVICRNSKGKYGYVLIEHLNFKHQGWSP